MTQFNPNDDGGTKDLVSKRDVILEADSDQDGVGDLIFRTGGVERARINYAGTGTGWGNVLGGSLSLIALPRASGDTTGVTDQAAIQAVLNAGTEAIYVFYPGDTYYLYPPGSEDGALGFRAGQRFWMYGATIFNCSDDTKQFATFACNDDTVHDCGWYGGTLDTTFTYGGSYTSPEPQPTGIYLSATSAATEKQVSNFWIDDVTFQNLRIGIHVINVDVDDVKRVGNVWISNIRGYHLYAALAQLDGKDIFVDGFEMDTGAFDCFDVHQGENVHISNGSVVNVSQYSLLARTLTKGNTKSVSFSGATDKSTLGVAITNDAASLSSQSVTDIHVSDVDIIGGGGFWIDMTGSGGAATCSDVSARGVVVNGSTRSGRAVFVNTANRVKLDVTVVNPTNTAVEFDAATDCVVLAKVAQSGTTQDLVFFGNTGGSCTGCAVLDGSSLNGGLRGVHILGGARNRVSGLIKNAAGDAVYIDGSTDNRIQVETTGNTGFGVHEVNGADFNVIVGSLRGNTSGPVSLTGAHDIVALTTGTATLFPSGSTVTGLLARTISAPTYGATVTPSLASNGPWQTITVTDANAFTIAAPTGGPSSSQTSELTIEVLNSSGGAMGVITWNAAFVFNGFAWTNPASTKKRWASFRWNGTKWVCSGVAGADY